MSETDEPIITEPGDNGETQPVEQDPSMAEKADETADALVASVKDDSGPDDPN